MSVCNMHPVTLCCLGWMSAFMMDQTLPSWRGFDSLFSEVKPPASVLVSSDHGLLGLWRGDMHSNFPLVLSPTHFKETVRCGEICVPAKLCLAAWSLERLPDPIYPPPLPRASSRETQRFCLFWRGHALYFLLGILSALKIGLVFVSSLEELKDNTYFILHSYLLGNDLWHQKSQPPP